MQGKRADQSPGSLVACRDRVTSRDGLGKVTDNEGEVCGTPQNALEVGEAAAGAPFPVPDLEVVRNAAQHHARKRWRVHDIQFQ